MSTKSKSIQGSDTEPIKKKGDRKKVTRRELADRAEKRRKKAAEAAALHAQDSLAAVWRCASMQNWMSALMSAWMFSLFVLACYDINNEGKFDLKTWVIVGLTDGGVFFIWAIYCFYKHYQYKRECLDTDDAPWSMKWSPVYLMVIAVLFIASGSQGGDLLTHQALTQTNDPCGYRVEVNTIVMEQAVAAGAYVMMCLASSVSGILSWKHLSSQNEGDLVDDPDVDSDDDTGNA